MMNYLTTLRCSVVFLLTVVLTPLFAEPANLSLVRENIKTYHDSGQYEQELAKAILKAQEFILKKAENYQTQSPNTKLAVVLDIDETSLSNYNYMVQRDFAGTHQQIHQQILAADSPAIKPMLSFYQVVLKHGIKVFFVTGRHESERNATIKNLLLAGYKNWSGLYLRPEQYAKPSIIPFKAGARAQIEKEGYVILASIGDQYSDLRGGYAEKGFKLPNPYYYLP